MSRKVRWAKFHEDVFVKGFGNAGNEIDTQATSSRYRAVALHSDSLGVYLTVTHNMGAKFDGFVPWTMVKFVTFAPEEPNPGASNKKAA